MSIASEYNAVVAANKAASATEKELNATNSVFPSIGAKWSLHKTQHDGRPYVRVCCADCKTMYTTGQLDFVFKHCGLQEPMPKELHETLHRLVSEST